MCNVAKPPQPPSSKIFADTAPRRSVHSLKCTEMKMIKKTAFSITIIVKARSLAWRGRGLGVEGLEHEYSSKYWRLFKTDNKNAFKSSSFLAAWQLFSISGRGRVWVVIIWGLVAISEAHTCII